MNDDRRVRTLGWLLIGGSLLINEPLIELVLVPDGEIEDPMLSAVVLGFACLGVAVGVYVLRRRPAWHLPGAAECALAAASLVLTLVFAESAARFWLRFVASESAQERYTLIHDIDGEELRYSRHHYLNYYTTPDFEKGDTRHNSLGFRGEEIAIPKPPNTFRIATLGGSTTYNYGVEDDDHTYPGRLEHHLREMGYRGVEVINAGVGGYNSFESLINLQFRVLDVEPDLVIVYQNTNDVHTRFVDPAFYRGDNFGRRRPWSRPEIRWWNHLAVLRIVLRKAGLESQVGLESFTNSPHYYGYASNQPLPQGLDFETILDKNPPIYFERNLRNMIAICREHGVDIMLATWAWTEELPGYTLLPHYQRGFEEMNEVVRRLGRSHDVPVYDFEPVMPDAAELWADGRHVNEKGAEVQATLFAQFIHRQKLIPTPSIAVNRE